MKAVNVVAQMVTANCPCGGSIVDMRTGSYWFTPDSITLECDTCGKHVTLGKSARLFS